MTGCLKVHIMSGDSPDPNSLYAVHLDDYPCLNLSGSLNNLTCKHISSELTSEMFFFHSVWRVRMVCSNTRGVCGKTFSDNDSFVNDVIHVKDR